MKWRSTYFLFIFSLTLLPFTKSFATVFKVEETKETSKQAEEVKKIILDFENSCQSGCLYQISHVKEMKVVEKESEEHFFTWYHIVSTKASQYFNEVEVSSPAKGEWVIKIVTPKSENIERLKNQYQLPHHPFFRKTETLWTLKEVYDDKQDFVKTVVSFESKATADSLLLQAFSGMIKKNMRSSAEEMFQLFDSTEDNPD